MIRSHLQQPWLLLILVQDPQLHLLFQVRRRVIHQARLELGVLLHSSPLSVDSRRLSAIQEATLSPHLILNILDDVVESGTLEGLVQHLIKHFGEQ